MTAIPGVVIVLIGGPPPSPNVSLSFEMLHSLLHRLLPFRFTGGF